jgi:hypothetical protein
MQTGKTKPADPNEAERLEFSDSFGSGSVRKLLQAQELFRRLNCGAP